jgi:hypothetical protein
MTRHLDRRLAGTQHAITPSMMTTVMHTKKMLQRSWDGMIARLSYTMAVFNVLIGWDGFDPDENGRTPLSIARFSL